MSTPGRAGQRWDRRRRQRRQLLAVLAAALLVALVVTVWFALRSPVPPSPAAAHAVAGWQQTLLGQPRGDGV